MNRSPRFRRRYPKKLVVCIGSSGLRALAVTLLLTGNLLPSFGGVSLALVGLAGSVALGLIEVVRFLPRVHPVLIDVLGLFSLLSVSLLWTDAPNDYGVEKITKLLTTTLLSALVVMIVRDRRDLSSLARVWPLLMLPIAFVSLAEFEGGRATGFDSNPIWVARAMSTGLLLFTWRVWSTHAKPSVVVTLVVPPALMGTLILTGSRGPLAGLVAGLLVLSIFTARGRFQKIASMGLGSIVILIFVVFSGLFSSSRLVQSFTSGDLLDSSGRDQLLPVALEVIRDHPEGVGIGNIGNYWNSHFDYPHNIFIEVLAEHGVMVGLTFVLVTVFIFGSLIWQSAHDDNALLLAALLAAEIVNVSLSGDLNARTFFFVLVLSMWMLHRSHREAIQNESRGIASSKKRPDRVAMPLR